MTSTTKFLTCFKRNIESTVRNVRRLSFYHFLDEYDYDEFLEGEAQECTSPRALAVAFAVRFLDSVPPDYSAALSMGLVNYLAECSGRRQLDASDVDAIKTLVALPIKDRRQMEQWLDAYFRDVS